MHSLRGSIVTLIIIGFMLAPTGIQRARVQPQPTGGLIANFYGNQQLTCGGGWTFPVLLDGHRPIGACMLKVKHRNFFGGPF